MVYRYINDDFEFFKETLALIPTVYKLYKDKNYGVKAVKWLMAVMSPRSPYNRSIDTREQVIERVNLDFFDRKTSPYKDHPDFEQAMEELKWVWYDVDEVALRSIDRAIFRESQLMDQCNDSEQVAKHATTLQKLQEQRDAYDERLKGKIKRNELDNLKLKNGKEMSYLMKKQQLQKVAESGTR